MKFIVTFREDSALSSQYPLPVQLEWVGATHLYLEKLKKENKVLDWGFSGTGQSFYAIFNVKSNIELYEIQELVPLRSICSIEGNPVLETQEFMDVFSKVRAHVVSNFEKNASHWNSSGFTGTTRQSKAAY